LDDLMSEMGSPQGNNASQTHSAKKDKKDYSSSSEDDHSKVYTLDDLDDLMAEVENQETRRRAPMTNEVKLQGARKTTTRKSAKGALDDRDLDNVLDTILHATQMNLATKKHEIGWGVINAERKFDLRAPEATQISKPCVSTIIVTTGTGERQRIEMHQITVEVTQNGSKHLQHTLKDMCDGTYEVTFTPTELGKCQLNIDTYGTRTFEFPIVIGGIADPSKCEALVITPLSNIRANFPLQISVVAKDERGDRFKVGGTLFSISFAGDGELYNVDLSDKMDGSYLVTVTPNKPGNYAVFISLGEVDIASSPVGFKANP